VSTYRVEMVNRDGQVLVVSAEQSILAAAEAAGIALPFGCRYGVCITCAARLIAGKVEHSRTVALKPEQLAADFVLLCVAHLRSDSRLQVGLESQWELYRNPWRPTI
jgi:ferredoxin